MESSKGPASGSPRPKPSLPGLKPHWRRNAMSDERDAGKGRTLVVDDEELNRILLSTSLQEAGYTVETAEDGRQALEMLSTEPFDIVLLDLVMPGMDGYEACKQIKA